MEFESRILIIEDDFIIAANLQEDLQETGYGVVGTAASYGQAEKLFIERNANFILADINLSETSSIDGIEIAARLNQIRKVPTIFLTAYYHEEYRNRAKVIQPAAYLIKPVQHKQLDIAIELALQKT